MKRRAAKLLVFLLLGAIVNVAVAWGCVMFVERSGNRTTLEDYDWPITPPNGWSAKATVYLESTWGITESYAFGSDGAGITSWSSGMATQYRFCAGLPLRSVQRTLLQVEYPGASYGSLSLSLPADWTEGVELPSVLDKLDHQYRRYYPLRPIWPGFAINTIFYAVILWVLFAFPFTLRRWRRVRKGLCPNCAYPVGESPVCTECGGAVKAVKKGSRHQGTEASPPHNMKRRVAKLAVFLLLGAIVNVAVAWGCVLWTPLPPMIPGTANAKGGWFGDVPNAWREPAGIQLAHTLALTRFACYGNADLGRRPYQQGMSSGVPMRCVMRESHGINRYHGRMIAFDHLPTQWHHGIVPPEWLRSPNDWKGRYFPLIPIWPGFAINTLFYAAMLWGVFAAPCAFRKWRRVRKGLCRACAYPVGASDVCTECGGAIRRT